MSRKFPTDADERMMMEDVGLIENDYPPADGSAVSSAAVYIRTLLIRVRRLEAGLGMISQLLSDRVPCMIATAALEGANLLDEDVAIEVCEGHWRKP